MPEKQNAGEAVAAYLERCGVSTAFGVISIHNLPILDAIGRRGRIRFVPCRGEAGACNMADAYARVSGSLGVCFTSTGTAAGNAAGALVEAQAAGTPLLHLTGQIETPYLDRNWAYIHEARDQLGMLRAVSKTAFRVTSPAETLDTLREAATAALTPPSGPVSVEIPIDVQEARLASVDQVGPPAPSAPSPPDSALDDLAEELAGKRRPLLWLGGGARHATAAAERLAKMGFGIVTSVQGRGILPEDHPRSLGAFNMQPPVPTLYRSCDAMLVAGSRLRGNETLKYRLKLPKPLYRIDADPAAEDGSYSSDLFVCGDARLALEALADRLEGRLEVDPGFAADLLKARQTAENQLLAALGPYARLAEAVASAAGRDFIWVRDVTIFNSTWGNRLPRLGDPRAGVHALGGGIGQGVAMGIGAALAADRRKTFCLVGDGGFQLNLGEIATAAQEAADMVILLMNSRDYGVIKNIQDERFGGRRHYSDLLTPDVADICRAVQIPHWRVTNLGSVDRVLAAAIGTRGPALIEIDMAEIGDFAKAFAGPPIAADALEATE